MFGCAVDLRGAGHAREGVELRGQYFRVTAYSQRPLWGRLWGPYCNTVLLLLSHPLTHKVLWKRGGQIVRPPSNSPRPFGNSNCSRTFLVLKFLLPVRFLSGAGELLCGGLVSGAWEAMASGSGAVGVSPSGTSFAGGSEGSIGEPGGKSEQVLMVRARRRC